MIASFWRVDDAATRELMERFYENLWKKDMGKLDALREARLWMLRGHGTRGLVPRAQIGKDGRLPPHDWGGFVLSGDWR